MAEEIIEQEQAEHQEVQEQSQPTSIDRLNEIYVQIAESDDIAYKTASFLTHSNYYSYALRQSNIINGRQGRTRLTVTADTSRLMGYSLETDVNDILDKQLTELLVGILNVYLSDKQELPSENKGRERSKIMGRVKALMIMLTSTNQYGIIPLLNIPPWILSRVGDLFDVIQRMQESALDNFIKWLLEHENPEMAEIVKATGNSFWGSEGIKANVIYDRYFGELDKNGKIRRPVEKVTDPNTGEVTEIIHDPYQAYLQFRAEYRKSTKNILPIKLYDIFDITPDAYNNMRENVYNEIRELFPEDENTQVIKRLIFEQ
jgi:hypothetical protein